MIVSIQFSGDDMEVGWLQHDVYRAALEIIVTGTNTFALAARHVLRDESHPSWGQVDCVDHRTLQVAHDILAAAWRWQILPAEPELFQQPEDQPFGLEQAWLTWLRQEVVRWIDEPEIIRLVQIVLSNQNEPTGYAAESRLGSVLLERFKEVPWRTEMKEAIAAEVAEIPEGILDDPKGLSVKPKCRYNSYRFPQSSITGESP
jgi:hypothetical protein